MTALAQVASVFPYSGLSDTDAARVFEHVPLDEAVAAEPHHDFYGRLKRLERFYLSCGGFALAMTSKALKVGLQNPFIHYSFIVSAIITPHTSCPT